MANVKKKVFQLDLNTGEVIATFNGITEAEAASGTSRSQISKCCRMEIKSTKGYAWCYAEDLHKIKKAITQPVRLKKSEVIEMLRKYHNILSYDVLSQKTGYTYEELRDLYDRYKIYRVECEDNDE